MKKLLVRSVLVFAMATSLIACSKDENTATPLSIVGKWEATTQKTKVTINGQLLQDSTQTYAANELVVEFFANGTAIGTSSDSSSKDDTLTYVFSGSTLTVISLDKKDTSVFNNTSFTASTLKMGMLDTQVENGYTIVSDFSINFNRK
ncbi:MAG: lipocalin family protein [Sphingobacteriales bacterium]|nr:lipocalin family protein [Sphingobacteriales bacterium]